MRRFIFNFICYVLTLTLCEGSLSRGKDYRKLGRPPGSEFVPNENKAMTVGGEPSCEELRAMWRFSRRQSRAAEITNEIPTYRDPFASNMWEQYPRPRSVIGGPRSGGRSWSRPIYGKVVQNAPSHHPRLINPESSRAYEEVLRYLDNSKMDTEPRRKMQGSSFRLSGGSLGTANRLSQGGSFQHLKEIIWAERAKELQQQRMLEEAVARSAALKDVQVPSHFNRAFPEQGQNNNFMYNFDHDASKMKFIEADPYNPGMSVVQEQTYRKPYRQRSVSLTEGPNSTQLYLT